jgi:hypothetical protein
MITLDLETRDGTARSLDIEGERFTLERDGATITIRLENPVLFLAITDGQAWGNGLRAYYRTHLAKYVSDRLEADWTIA